jgi:large subunit ribosomal protein L24
MRSQFSTYWKRSKQPRKQRKYRYNAPLHIRRKLMSVHLSKELRQKHNKRNVPVIKGDTVKILRGQFKGKTGKVSKVDYQNLRIYVEGVEIIKKDGNKVLFPINPSNLTITTLKLEDKKRIASLERK